MGSPHLVATKIGPLDNETTIVATEAAALAAIEAAAKAALTAAVNDIATGYQDRIDAIADDATIYGLANADLQTEKAAVQAAFDAANQTITPTMTSADVKAISDAVKAVEPQIKALEDNAAAAKAKVVAQTAAKTAADAAVAAVKEELATAKGAKETEYKDQTIDWTAIEAAITDVEGTIADKRAAETLAEADYKTTLATISADIKTAKDNAVKTQQNQEAAAALNTLADEVATAIATAKTDAVDAEKGDPAAPAVYADLLDDAKDGSFTKQLNAIKDEIATAITDKKVFDKKADITKKLNDLKDAADGIAALAKKNLDEKNKQQDAYNSAKAAWNEVSLKLASVDESSELPTRQEKLTELKDKLTPYQAKIDEDYAAGKSDGNGVEKAVTDIESTIREVLAEVIDKDGNLVDSYDTQIATDNKGMWDKFNEELEKAQEVYKDAAQTVKEYSSVRSTVLADVISTVSTQSDKLNASLVSFYEDQQELFNRVKAEYLATQSPNVFDKDSTYVKDARALAKSVKDNKDAYLKAIENAVNDKIPDFVTATKKPDGSIFYSGIYPKSINDAMNVVCGYWNYKKYLVVADDATDEGVEANKALRVSALNQLFGELYQLIATIADAKNALDLVALDEALLKAQDSSTGIDATIASIEKNEAYSALNKNLLEVEANTDVLTDDEKQDVQALRKSLEEYLADGSVVAKYDDVKNDIEHYRTQVINQDVDAAYENFMAEYNKLQEQIDAAKEYASQYAVYDQILSHPTLYTWYYSLNLIQQRIDEYKTNVENYLGYDWSNAYKTNRINNQKNNLTISNIPSRLEKLIGRNLFDLELAWINDVMTDRTASVTNSRRIRSRSMPIRLRLTT